MDLPAGLHTEVTGLHVERRAADGPASGGTIVMVHGAMDRGASFGRVGRHLREFDVVRYDRRGYGKSTEMGIGTLRDHVDDLLTVIDDREVCVFGHSIGGVIALVAAQEAPGLVRSVLAFEPPMPWLEWWPQPPAPDPGEAPLDPADEAEAFMRRAIGDHYWSRLPQRTRDDRRAEGRALLADIASVQEVAPFETDAIAPPVVVGAGSDTTWWHRRASSELASALPAGHHAVIAGATHGTHLTHPAATADLVEQAAALGGMIPVDRR